MVGAGGGGVCAVAEQVSPHCTAPRHHGLAAPHPTLQHPPHHHPTPTPPHPTPSHPIPPHRIPPTPPHAIPPHPIPSPIPIPSYPIPQMFLYHAELEHERLQLRTPEMRSTCGGARRSVSIARAAKPLRSHHHASKKQQMELCRLALVRAKAVDRTRAVLIEFLALPACHP